jgi:hypothetical protein
LYRRLGEPQSRSGQVLKTSPPPRFDPRIVQPVASRYTDYAMSAHLRKSRNLVGTQLHVPAVLPRKKNPQHYSTTGWKKSISSLDTVNKRNIPCLCREPNNNTSAF